MYGAVILVAIIAVALVQLWPVLSSILFTGQYAPTAEVSAGLAEAIAARAASIAAAAPSAASPRPGRSLMIPHGGGPLPVLGEPNHRELAQWLRDYPKKALPKFSAIVVVSAHWEADIPTITSGNSPSLIYDYYGFPEEAYRLQYPAPGSPALAAQLSDLLHAAGIDNRLDARRGWDHGVFIPLMLMYPAANIPVVQLSLVKGLDPDLHIRMGLALAPLLDREDVLILGSGFTFHNMPAFFGPAFVRKRPNEAFEEWLRGTASDPSYNATERAKRFVNWDKAPSARFCHPREEHLLPLHVCFGAGSCERGEVALDAQGFVRTSAYLW